MTTRPSTAASILMNAAVITFAIQMQNVRTNRAATVVAVAPDSMAMATHAFQLMQKQRAKSHLANQQHQVYRHWRRSIGCVINVHRMRNACRAFVSVVMVGRVTVFAVYPYVPKAMCLTRRNAYRLRPRKSVCACWRLQNSMKHFYCVFFLVTVEVEPFCHKDGCSCATGYQLHQDNERTTCLLYREGADGQNAQCKRIVYS